MGTLGVWLRQAREAQGSTLDEAGDATHIRPRFLEALEAGDFAAFPGGEVQVRGFLRIYARYLGLSPDEVLARYDTEVHGVKATAPPGVPAKTQPVSSARSAPVTRPTTPTPSDVPVPTFRPRWMAPENLLIVAIAVVILLAMAAGGWYLVSRNAGEEAAATATTPAEAVVLPTAMATPFSPIVTVTPTFPANPQGGVTLALEATEHVWVRVTADGSKVFENLMATGQVESWSGQEVIVVETGNGAGLLVTVNGQPQGAMCGRGQICTRAWGPVGEVTSP